MSNTPCETCEKTPKGNHQQALREVASSQAACVPWPECLDKGCLGHIGNDGLVHCSILCRGPGQAWSLERTGTSLTWEEGSAGVLLTQ